MTQRFIADMTNSDGNTVRSDLVATSFESKDGHMMKFTLKNALNGKTAEHFEGTAQLASSGTGAVELSVPKGSAFPLPSGAVLPTEHTLDVLHAIASGSNTIHQLVFQGGDKNDLYDATVLIGRPVTQAEMAQDRAHDPDGLLKGQSARTVLISYFNYGSREATPSYEVAYRLYGNGIVTAMSLIYSNFTLSADVTKIEKLASSWGPVSARPLPTAVAAEFGAHAVHRVFRFRTPSRALVDRDRRDRNPPHRSDWLMPTPSRRKAMPSASRAQRFARDAEDAVGQLRRRVERDAARADLEMRPS